MKTTSAIIAFFALLYSTFSNLRPDKIDHSTIKFIVFILDELRFEIVCFSIIIILIQTPTDFYKKLKAIIIKIPFKYKLSISIVIVFIAISLIPTMKLFLRERGYYYKNIVIYKKFINEKINFYQSLVERGLYLDSQEYFESDLKNYITENEKQLVMKIKRYADNKILISKEKYEKYIHLRKQSKKPLSRLYTPNIFEAFYHYPNNLVYREEIDSINKKLYSADKTINTFYNHCKNDDIRAAYNIYKDNAWYYYDEVTMGYLLPDNLYDFTKIDSLTTKLCKNIVKTSIQKFRSQIHTTWQIGKLYKFYTPDISHKIKIFSTTKSAIIKRNSVRPKLITPLRVKDKINYTVDNIDLDPTFFLNLLKSFDIPNHNEYLELLTEKKFLTLIEKCETEIAKDKNSAFILHFLIAEALFYTQKYDTAIIEYNIIISNTNLDNLNKYKPYALFRQSQAFYSLGDIQTSLIVYNKIRDTFPDHDVLSFFHTGQGTVQGNFSRAHQQFRDGNYKEACKLFEKSISAENDKKRVISIYYMMGECLYKLGEFDLAIINYQKIISNYPGTAEVAKALLRQAEAFEKLSDNETAKIIYKKLIRAYASSPEAESARKSIEKL